MRVLPFTKYSPCGNTTILVRESSLSPADRARVAAEIIAPGHLEAEQGFCAVATTEEIAAQDFILTPGRYVGIAAQAEDSEPFAAKMERLTGELSDLFARSHTLEAEIRRQLEKIGYKL